MQKEVIEIIEKNNESVLESIRKITELNMRTFDKMFQQQAELAAYYMDVSSRGMDLITKAKGYQDLMAGQTAIAREIGERNLSVVRNGMTEAYATGTEYSNLVQEGVKLTKEQMAQASEAAMKVAA
ncbi:MAG: phasin family protein [Pseudomonadota bacterium]|jgi:CO dehydrogenase/acetyl-CoA synthase epsilon subunit|nr:phasin family protein [Pseudomonadota bacterium]MDP1903749.1 phasin family protein [Pseudomonadota bacterium]MDP2351721.1 phasin family protein [Pseudomonadota bacterium]